jgi:MurNAc alpha-1-phosphate uridylyltransferase
MIFAAGFGTRMRWLTRDRPKALVEVAGRPLLDHAIDLARDAGLGRIVVNAHYLADQVEAHLAPTRIPVSREADRILDTGGGLRRALPLLGPGPVFTLNPDVVWTGANPLRTLAEAWEPGRTDALLLLARVAGRTGDFRMGPDERLSRGGPKTFLGAQIIEPRVLHEIPEEVFSLNRAWDLLAARGRLHGAVHRGGWCDVGTPDGIGAAERLLVHA